MQVLAGSMFKAISMAGVLRISEDVETLGASLLPSYHPCRVLRISEDGETLGTWTYLSNPSPMKPNPDSPRTSRHWACTSPSNPTTLTLSLSLRLSLSLSLTLTLILTQAWTSPSTADPPTSTE
eukprot:scaffold24649_cov60-Phaeocystis_antarctica.AAC.1